MAPPAVVPSVLYVVVLLIAVILLGCIESTAGQPSKWCREAHDRDTRIKYIFCYDGLMGFSKREDWEDPWRMAKVSAFFGAQSGKKAIKVIRDYLAKPETDHRVKPALQECEDLYDKVEDAYLRARNRIDSRGQFYASTRTEVALAAFLAQQCEDAFARTGVRSTLHGAFLSNQQIGYICLALISIIDH